MKRASTKTRIVQSIYGTLLIITGVISAVITDGDITAAVLLIPLGIYAIITNKVIVK